MLALVGSIIALTAETQLPTKVDLRPRFERLGLSVCNQNGPLCWDYTLLGLLEFELATRNRTTTRLSAGFLSWAASATDAEGQGGSNFGRAHRGLEKFGIAPLAFGGDPDVNGVGRTPDRSTLEAAAATGAIDLQWIRFWNDRESLSLEQLGAIKTEIASGHPVAVGMRWPKHLAFFAGSFLLQVPTRTDVFDGHCVALVGYEDRADLPGGGAFLFRNSWGEKWADGGYARMPYGLLSFCINDAVSVRINPPTRPIGAEPMVFEAESLRAQAVVGPKPTVQPMSQFGNGWGGNKQLFFSARKVGDSFTLELPISKAGKYELLLVTTRSQDYGRFKVDFVDRRGEFSAVEFDGVGPGVSRSRPLNCGTIQLQKGTASLRLTVIGKGIASSSYCIGLDQVLLVPVRDR